MNALQQRVGIRTHPSAYTRLVAAHPLRSSPRLYRASSQRVSEGNGEAATEAAAGGLRELTKDDYWQYIKGEENKGTLIVVDCYTDWCGPCKMIMPELIKLSEELEPRGRVVKFNCNKANKDLGVTLKIKVAPTFIIYRDGEKLDMMTGAKMDKLKALVNGLLEAAPVSANV